MPPEFSTDVPGGSDLVLGGANTLSLDFKRDQLNYLQVANAPGFSFGANPFTIESWVRLKSLPAGADAAGTMPVAMKRALATTDSNIDYMFLATAGIYGDEASFGNLALVLGSTTVVSTLAIPDTVSLTFESNENFLYDIQFSTTLEPDGWITVRSFVAGTTDAATTTASELPLPDSDRGFYRVVLHPSPLHLGECLAKAFHNLGMPSGHVGAFLRVGPPTHRRLPAPPSPGRRPRRSQ